MQTAKNYLEQLYKKEADLFSKPLEASTLTEADLQEIETSLGYSLPEQYKEFLQSYQMDDMTVYIALCGNAYGCSFNETFSREKKDWVLVKEDDPYVLVDLQWHGFVGKNAKECLARMRQKIGEMSVWLEAGYLWLGSIYEGSYMLFYDLKTGEVSSIHHEDMYLVEDWDDPNSVRECMEVEATEFCRDFHDFLRLACLGEAYDEDDMIFPEEDEI